MIPASRLYIVHVRKPVSVHGLAIILAHTSLQIGTHAILLRRAAGVYTGQAGSAELKNIAKIKKYILFAVLFG